MDHRGNDGENALLDLIAQAARTAQYNLSDTEWNTIIQYLDTQWIESIQDIQLVIHSRLQHTLKLPNTILQHIINIINQHSSNNNIITTNTIQPINNITLKYSSDFDNQGLLYFLGTKGKTCPWTNPVDLGEVLLSSSELEPDSVPSKHLVGRNCVRLITKNREQSWFTISLLNCSICPTAYSLRHYSSWDTEVIRNWRFEGSGNGKEWELIMEHHQDSSLAESKGATNTWRVQTSQSFRHFRIIQTGRNSNNHYYLALSGFELYGNVEFSEARFIDSTLSNSKENELNLTYVYDLDTNGLFYYIGTSGKSESFVNPQKSGIVFLSSSGLGIGSDPIDNLVDRGHASVQITSFHEPWLEINLLDILICPLQYSIRHQFDDDANALRCWKLEGFDNSSQKWVLISVHTNDQNLTKAGACHTWSISQPTSCYCSKFRLSMTSPNSSGSMVMALSNLEFYGILLKRRDFQERASWDADCCSPYLKILGPLLLNSGSNNSWQSCRLNKSFSRGLCEVSFKFESSCETTNSWKASVGLVPIDFVPKGRLHWLGSQNSWAYIAGNGCTCYGTATTTKYGEMYDEGDIITITVDFFTNKISFAKNGVSQGVAFTNLSGPVFPAVSLTGTGSSFRLISFKSQGGNSEYREPLIEEIPECKEASVLSEWDANMKTQDLFLNPENLSMVTNLFDGNKWEMVRSSAIWDLRITTTVEFEIKILEDPPTKNKWRFMLGLCPSTFEISHKPPVWLGKGCWAYIAGNGQVFFDDVKNPESYGRPLTKNDILSVRIDSARRQLKFGVNGEFGKELPLKSSHNLFHAAVCMTAQNACAQLYIRKSSSYR